jgi:hypothetical protein
MMTRWHAMQPCYACEILRDAPVPWWIAGGWALALFAGSGVHRPHKDLDVGVLRRDAPALLGVLADWQVFEAHRGVLTRLPTGRLPRSEVNSLWCRCTEDSPWTLEVMLDDADGSDWVFRRDRRVRVPMTRAVQRRDDVPYLAPEIQLLYKARRARLQDTRDFHRVVSRLDRARRAWLHAALHRTEPLHPWLKAPALVSW